MLSRRSQLKGPAAVCTPNKKHNNLDKMDLWVPGRVAVARGGGRREVAGV
jgi:hypothetical protein